MAEEQNIFPAWSKKPEQVLRHHGVSIDVGLTEAEVEERHQHYGWNELEKPPSPSMWALILQQFDDMLVKVRSRR
jgi:Ca2+-transporting ATPase